MTRSLRRVWMTLCVCALATAPVAVAQDMTAGMVTDPPAPVADDTATFTGTYENLGPGPAADINVNYAFSIQPETWPPESDGFTALLDSTVGTDTNGNDAFWAIWSDRMCQHYMLQLQMPNDTGDQSMVPNPLPAGEGGTFAWQLPIIPMEGPSGGRLVITEPERLRNSYSMLMDAYNTVGGKAFDNIAYQQMGTFNLVYQPPGCEDGGDDCVDMDACPGPRLWTLEPFEADLVLADDGFSDEPYACGDLVNADEIAGKIALVKRGGSTFDGGLCYLNEKMLNAQFAGAAAAILVNGYTSSGDICGDFGGDPEECMGPFWGVGTGEGYLYTMPFVTMSKRQGDELIAAIRAGETVRAMMGNVPDDVLDVYTLVYSPEDDTNQDNDFGVTRVPLGEMGPTEYMSFISAAGYAAGSGDSFWVTDVDVSNTSDEDITFNFMWLPRGEDNAAPVTSEDYTLAAGTSERFPNILDGVFGLSSDDEPFGAIGLDAQGPGLVSMARIFNQGDEGTFGQALPSVVMDGAKAAGDRMQIVSLTENDAFRSNVGCQNGTATEVRVSMELFNSSGESLEVKTMDLAPYSNNQINRVFREYSPMNNGYVEVWTDTADGAFFCYGSVVDSGTGDPTTVLPATAVDMDNNIPAAGYAEGTGGSFWVTDVDLTNPGDSALQYTFEWLPRGEDNSDPMTSDVYNLVAGGNVRYANILGEVFGLDAADAPFGALNVKGDLPIISVARIFNQGDAGTFGQAIPGLPAAAFIATGTRQRIIFMTEDDAFRSNVGCQNGGGSSVRISLELFNSAGESQEVKVLDLAPWSNNQINRIFRSYSPIDGYVEVWTSTPDSSFYCYGSVVDNVTGDPTTVMPQ